MPRTEEQRNAYNAKRRLRYVANSQKEKAQTDLYRRTNPERVKVWMKRAFLKRKFGLSLEKYEEMVKQQNGVCAICQKVDYRALSVDHNHETGQIRELLCSNCNVLLGHCGEDENVLSEAIRYLRKHSNTTVGETRQAAA